MPQQLNKNNKLLRVLNILLKLYCNIQTFRPSVNRPIKLMRQALYPISVLL